jgi:dTDP-4-dehydrorhamnose reductase
LNEALPARVAGWCAQHGVRLLHVSTDLVFGREPAPPGGFSEGDVPAPLGVYGETKAAGERALLAADAAALVVRLPLLFGDSRGRGLGASDGLLAAIARGERPRLHLDEWRTPLDVRDAAGALVELVHGDERGLLHVAGPERVNRLQLGLLTLLARGDDPVEAQARLEPARRADFRAGPPRAEDTSLDASRALALLRTPLRGVRQALTGA